MGPWNHLRHHLNGHAIRLVLIWLCIVSLAAGCSPLKTVKNTGRKLGQMTWAGNDLHKKIGFVRFVNQTPFPGRAFAKTFQQNLSGQFTEICTNLKQVGGNNMLNTLPVLDNGRVDNLTLASAGRQLGLNALVDGAVISVGAFQRSEGWFWFKSTHYYVQAQVAVDVYDIQTGAKLLYESLSREIEIDDYQQDAFQGGSINNAGAVETNMGAVETALSELAEIAAEKICDRLAQVPWVGYVTAVTDSGVVLSAGGDIGLEDGQIFDILPTDRVYEGKDGQEYLVPGIPSGQIRIATVSPDRAEAVLVSGKMPVVGDAVRLAD